MLPEGYLCMGPCSRKDICVWVPNILRYIMEKLKRSKQKIFKYF